MGVDWYNSIAIRNGGYKTNAKFLIEGINAENIYEQELIELLPNFNQVLDAGCGHGDFTIRMSQFAKSIVGFDNSIELIKIAKSNQLKRDNIEFVFTSTKEDLPFKDEQFDFIYDRRGPTSILNHSRILRSGGTVFGIHSGALELVKERLQQNGFINVEIREYKDSRIIFPNRNEYVKFVSDIPGNPDYSEDRYKDEVEKMIIENTTNGIIQIKEYKYIWKALKP
ncbi:class I SAM-dependent methyltransferase [Saccharibacillus sp. JS10]|uniref:class I SAM-dependent methyltransferase n=1 Tax=Saccharibacillus sp. JS10 TaxID=2950552 RepID=UPI00210DD570|nr:class I SAM-dependent methyltransferase [Saccharibacillus sp. JS10]MCQ4088441.1 class I SAM-dependent methyltransferase [Saccharibacillus sp. JS10]